MYALYAYVYEYKFVCICVCGCAEADKDTPSDQEKTLELIRYLVPEVFNGALVDSLSCHALSAAGMAASYLCEVEEQAMLQAPPLSICSVIRAQKPGRYHPSVPSQNQSPETGA